MNAETNSLNRQIAKLDSLFLWVSSLSGIGFSIFIAYLKMPLEPYLPIFALIAYSLYFGYVSGAIFSDSFTERIRGWGYLTLGLTLYAPLAVIKLNESSIYDLLNSPKAVPYLQIVIGFALPLGYAYIYNKFAVPKIYGILKQPKEGVTDIILWRSILASFYLGSLLYISALALFEKISVVSHILYVCFFVIFLVPLISEEIRIRDFLRLEKYQSYVEVEKRIDQRRWKTSMIIQVAGTIAYVAQFELFPYLPLYVWIILFLLAIMLLIIGLVLILQLVPVRYTFTLKTKAKKELSKDQHKELKDLVSKMNSPNPPKKGEEEKKCGNASARRLRSLYLKFVEEIKRMGEIPNYDYEKVLRQIQHASYPASLGMINLGLYQYVKSTELQTYANPEIFFLIASVLFFFISVMIGFGIGIAMEEPLFSPAEQQELKYRQAFVIVIAFGMAIAFDFLGLMFLAVMHVR